METKVPPSALPCNSPTYELCPNPPQFYEKSVPIKDLKWFVNQIASFVFVASPNYQGVVKIEDHDQAKHFYNNQFERYVFLTLQDQAKQALSEMYYNRDFAFQEPELEKLYLLMIYENGILKESHPVIYSGFTHNLKWYVFNFINGTDNAGNSCRLLKVGYFPTYQNAANPEAAVFEQYIPLT